MNDLETYFHAQYALRTTQDCLRLEPAAGDRVDLDCDAIEMQPLSTIKYGYDGLFDEGNNCIYRGSEALSPLTIQILSAMQAAGYDTRDFHYQLEFDHKYIVPGAPRGFHADGIFALGKCAASLKKNCRMTQVVWSPIASTTVMSPFAAIADCGAGMNLPFFYICVADYVYAPNCFEAKLDDSGVQFRSFKKRADFINLVKKTGDAINKGEISSTKPEDGRPACFHHAALHAVSGEHCEADMPGSVKRYRAMMTVIPR